MRRNLLLACLLCACAPKDAKQSDTVAMAAPPMAAAPAPAALTADMMKGTWNGTNMAEMSDSVTGRWVVTDGAMVIEGRKDTVRWVTTYDADSMMSVSPAMPASPAKNAPMVVNHGVGRMVDGKLVGTSFVTLAAKPDSVVMRGRWEATRKP